MTGNGRQEMGDQRQERGEGKKRQKGEGGRKEKEGERRRREKGDGRQETLPKKCTIKYCFIIFYLTTILISSYSSLCP